MTSVDRLRPRLIRPYVPASIRPHPKQHAALLLQHIPEIMFGGAGGGGKTIWMLMEALAYVDHPEYAGLLVRRTYPNLKREPDGLIPVSHKWLANTPAHWSGDTRTWTFPSGATLAFAHLSTPDSHTDIAGPGYTFIGVDEATEIRPNQYEYLESRMRKPQGSPIPVRRRAASNPGGRHHSYYAKRFGLDGKTAPTPGTLYIPSLLTDNPHLDRDDYYARLSGLDPVLRARIRDGDWTITESGHMFDVSALHVVAGPGPDHCIRMRAWDLAAEEPVAGSDPDYTVGTLVAVDPTTYGQTTFERLDDGTEVEVPLPPVTYVEDVIRIRKHPDEVDRVVHATASRDGAHVTVGLEQERGGAGKHLVASWKRNLPGYRVVGLEPDAPKPERARQAAAAVGFGRVHIVAGAWNADWLEEVSQFPDTEHADQVDTFAYAVRHLAKPPPSLVHRAGRQI